MNKHDIRILVIGSDSFLGSNFLKYLDNFKISYVATSRRVVHAQGESKRFLDLDSWQQFDFKDNFTHAVIFAGISGYENCANEPNSWNINVTCTVGLSEFLMSKGLRVAVISSSAVFSSTTDAADEYTPVNPDSEYGRQKAEMEKLSIALAGNQNHSALTIVRPTKVMCKNTKIFLNWQEHILQDKNLIVFEDLFIAPISLDYFCKSLTSIILSNKPGIYHLSGDQSVSYASLALKYASALRPEFKKIKYVKSDEKVFYKHTSGKLTMKNTVNSFQIHPQSISDFLRDVLV